MSAFKSAVAGDGTSEAQPASASPVAERLAELIRASDCVVALTGAGISVPSGIPDYRSPRTGLWEKVDPMEVAHIDVFRRDPERFWSFYGERLQTLQHRNPNPAHVALAELERAGLLKAVITQNIDRLHAKAGTRKLIEVHGSIEHSSCPRCGGRYGLGEVGAQRRADAAGVPRCDCGRALKPGVVLFGERLPQDELRRAQQLASDADLMVCVGSSLEVYPVAELPTLTLAGGGRLAIVTQGATPLDARATVRCGGDVVDELGTVIRVLRVG